MRDSFPLRIQSEEIHLGQDPFVSSPVSSLSDFTTPSPPSRLQKAINWILIFQLVYSYLPLSALPPTPNRPFFRGPRFSVSNSHLTPPYSSFSLLTPPPARRPLPSAHCLATYSPRSYRACRSTWLPFHTVPSAWSQKVVYVCAKLVCMWWGCC